MANKEYPQVYSLQRLKVENFRGINSTELTDIPKGTRWIFLTGKNGYGKTCILQAAFIGLFGSNLDNSSVIEKGDFNITIEGYFPEKYAHTINSNTFEKTTKNTIPVVAYGTSRLSITHSKSSNNEQEESARFYSLFNPDGVLLNIENELKNWFYRSGSKEIDNTQGTLLRLKYDSVVQSLLRLMPNVASIQVDISEDKVIYKEKDENGSPIPQNRFFSELASGNKSIIAMAGDLMIRLFHMQPEATKTVDLKGIVLIDELDLHLHPEWQKKLPCLLSQVFPQVQFIASTHSPIPFLGAPKGSVFIKVNRTVEEGITVEKLDINISDLTPNLILSSPIFGFTEIFPVTHQNGKRIRTEDLMEEVWREDDIVAGLKSFLGKDKEKRLESLLKS